MDEQTVMRADLDLPILDIQACVIDWHGIPQADRTDGRDLLRTRVLEAIDCRSTGQRVTCLYVARKV